FLKSLTSAGRAVADGNPGSGCVLALDSSANGAITSSGSAAVTLRNCNHYDNSSSGSALNASGSTKISALSAGVVGGVSGSSNITTTNGIFTGMEAMTDPYAGSSFGSFAGCNQTNF